MGVSIGVESEEAKGSLFYFRLPSEKGEETALPTPLVEKTIIEPNTHERLVLLVEDNVSNQLVVSGILERINLKTVAANNGFEAIGFIEQGDTFDLILMDIQLPGIRDNQVNPHAGYPAPIIGLSARASVEYHN